MAVDWAEGCEVSRFHRFIRRGVRETSESRAEAEHVGAADAATAAGVAH